MLRKLNTLTGRVFYESPGWVILLIPVVAIFIQSTERAPAREAANWTGMVIDEREYVNNVLQHRHQGDGVFAWFGEGPEGWVCSLFASEEHWDMACAEPETNRVVYLNGGDGFGNTKSGTLRTIPGIV